MFHRIYKLQFISKISRAHLTFFSMMLKSTSFPLPVLNRISKLGKTFLYSHLSFTAVYSLKSEKIGLLILLNCEAASLTVFTTPYPKEQQTSDNLIVKDYCFIVEIFSECSFSDIPRGFVSHLNEAWKE